MNITVNAAAIKEASQKLSNWGRWGKDDMSGSLTFVEPHHIVEAAKLIKKGKSFALGIPLDRTGPQSGLFGGRFNPIHQMLRARARAPAARERRGLAATRPTQPPRRPAARPTAPPPEGGRKCAPPAGAPGPRAGEHL